MSIPVFTLTGTVHVLKGDVSAPVSGTLLAFTSNVNSGDLMALDNVSHLIDPQDVRLDRDGKINGDVGIELLANDDSLALSTPLQWTVSAVNAPGGHRIGPWTFEAPAAGAAIDLKDVQPVVGMSAQGIIRGPKGDQGEQGIQGQTGETGATGAPGALSPRETPSGTVNGINTTFTLAHTPLSGTEVLTYNGLEQTAGVDYTMSGATITFSTAPLSGVLLCTYWY